MIVVIDGRLFQWDTGRKVRIVAKDHSTITEVHAYYEGESDGYKVNTVADGDAVIAPIPNILLQENKTIEICAVSVTEDGIRTVDLKTCHVYARSKPPNYVYTETEILNYKYLEDRLKYLEEYGVSDAKLSEAVNKTVKKAVDDYFDKHPAIEEETDPTVPEWAKAKEKPKYTAEEVGAIPKDTPIPPIRYVESLDFTSLETLVSIRSLESNTYILYGRFVPFEGSSEVFVFSSGMLASIIRRNVISYMQIFYPEDNTVQYFEITDDECSRTNTDLVNMENVKKKVIEIDENSTDEQYPSAKATYDALTKKEDLENKVIEITDQSTDEQYPSAKAVNSELEKKENVANKVKEISEFSTDEQYPSAKAVYELSKSSETFDKKVTVIDSTVTHEQYPSAKATYTALLKKEDPENKVTEITTESTDEQYPSAKAVREGLVPRMTMIDEMMFEKFGTGEKDYFFSQANWDDLQRYNRAYVQAYDDENDLRLGEDGKGLYALRAICRYGAGTVPRYPWMKKSEWVAKYRENNPQTELTDEEIITNHPPKDTDFENMATLIERQPNGFIKVPTSFPKDKTEAQMEGYTVPKKYADSIKDIALGAVQKIDCPDKNRYAYTVSMNNKGESVVSLMKMGANPTADVNQPLIRRRTNGAVGTLKIPQADDDAASKYYVDTLNNGANKAVSYGNYSTMITALNNLPKDAYKVGQNIMIVTLNVPDLWVSEVATSTVGYSCSNDAAFVNSLKTDGYVQVGYYKLSMLETQKVDLTAYPTTAQLTSGAVVPKNATNATRATYADTDTSKGTIASRLANLENRSTSTPTLNSDKKLTGGNGYYYIELWYGLSARLGQGIVHHNETTGTKLYIKSPIDKFEGFILVSPNGQMDLYTIATDGSYSKETSTVYKIETAKIL